MSSTREAIDAGHSIGPCRHVHSGEPPSARGVPEFSSPPELQYPSRLNCASELLDRQRRGGQRCQALHRHRHRKPGLRDLLKRSTRLLAHWSMRWVWCRQPGAAARPNNPWLVASWFGVVKAGGVAVTTMPMLRTGELETIVEIAGVDHRDLRPPVQRGTKRWQPRRLPDLHLWGL